MSPTSGAINYDINLLRAVKLEDNQASQIILRTMTLWLCFKRFFHI